MKRMFLIGAIFFELMTPIGFAEIAGSKHDFSGVAWNTEGMCQPCHTPHGALPIIEAPLWSHTLSTATYTPYTSSTMSQVSLGPNSSSKLCLSCHDGTTALDAFVGQPDGNTFISGGALLGTNLSNDHPIGIKWIHSDGFDYDCSSCHSGFSSDPTRMPAPFFPVPDGNGGMDYTVECASCHDPHNAPNIDKLLRITNVGSALCLQCHVK